MELFYKRIVVKMLCETIIKWNCQEWFVKYIEVGVRLQRDCSQREPSDELDSHGGRVFLPIVEDEDDQKWTGMRIRMRMGMRMGMAKCG